jgi:predicted lactoylglutathione lyase
MDDEALTTSIRKFLKTVGVCSQREIEQAVAKARNAGALAGHQGFPATMTLRVPGLSLEVTYDGEIRVEP